MDIYRFFNSDIVCRYIMELQADNRYRDFSSVEKAWLIYQCQDATIEERLKAWQWIVDNERDCGFVTYDEGSKVYHESLHEFLTWHMNGQRALMNKFLNANEVHKCIYHFCTKSRNGSTTYPVVFESFERGIDFLRGRIPGDTASIVCETLDIGPNWVNVEYEDGFSMTTCSQNHYLAVISPDFEFRKIIPMALMNTRESGDNEFEGMHPQFPLPFRKGDVLCIKDKNEGSITGQFVYGAPCDREADKEKLLEQLNWEGIDIEDDGYLQKKQGHLDIENLPMDRLMNCEYYDEAEVLFTRQ